MLFAISLKFPECTLKKTFFFQRRRVAVWLGTSYQLSSPGGGGGSGLLGNHMVFQGNGWGISLLGWPEFSALALL